MLHNLRRWLERNPPEDMPYWPGAATSGRVGIRKSQKVLDRGASPLHPGVDRYDDGDAKEFTVPFDGDFSWTLLSEKSVAGSLLQIKAHGVDLELQVFHTEHAGPDVDRIGQHVKKGDPMPVDPGDRGLTLGVHPHTEVLTPYDEELRAWILESAETIIGSNGNMHTVYVRDHCGKYGLDADQVMQKIWSQVRLWGILEMTTLYMIRNHTEPYRQPAWGAGKVMHIDSTWLLKI